MMIRSESGRVDLNRLDLSLAFFSCGREILNLIWSAEPVELMFGAVHIVLKNI